METTSAAATVPVPSGSSTSAGKSRSLHEIFSPINVSEFDWEAYQGTYRGRALITRLNHIPTLILSDRSGSSSSSQNLQLARAALQRLLPLVKATWDTQLYLRIATTLEDTRHGVQALAAKTGEDDKMEGVEATAPSIPAPATKLVRLPNIPTATGNARGEIDVEWVESVREQERKETGKLDVELRGYMSNLIKESIRLTYLAFAQLSMKSGKANDVLKAYGLAREYSTSVAHQVELSVGIIDTQLAFNQTSALAGHITKLEAALDRAYPAPVAPTVRVGNEQAAAASANLTAADVRENQEKEARSAETRRNVGVKLRVAKGLDALGKYDWERAGRELGEIGEEGGLAGWEGQAISTADLALISALCTLASSGRDRIRRVLLDRTSFRSAVNDSQSWLIDLVRAFMEAKYGEVTIILNKAEPYLYLNPFLHPHVRDLIALIQTRAIVQYVAPFSTIKIEIMAKAFDRDTASMSKEVESLVKDGRIKGRVDLIDGILEMKQTNVRAELFQDAMGVAKSTTRSSKAALLRMRLHKAGINVDPRPSSDSSNNSGLPLMKTGTGIAGSSSGPSGSAGDGFEMMDGPPAAGSGGIVAPATAVGE